MIIEGTLEDQDNTTEALQCEDCLKHKKTIKNMDSSLWVFTVIAIFFGLLSVCLGLHNSTLNTELLDTKEKAQFVKNDLRDARQEERILQENIFSMLQEKGDLERQIRSKQLKPTPKGNMVSLQVSARFEDGHTQTVIVPNVPTLPTYHQ